MEARLHLGGMFSRMTRVLVASVLATGAIACDDPGPTAPVTETPVVENVTETYSGRLARNGAVTFPFAVQTTGTLTLTLADLSSDAAALGLSLGTWNGITCAAVIANDNAFKFTQVIGAAGSATGSTEFCVRIYDVGRLSEPVTFTITLVHP